MKNALSGVERGMFWTLAIAAFAAAAVGLLARAADRLAVDYTQDRRNYAIVTVIAPEGRDAMEAAQTALETTPFVASAAPMTEGRAAALLGLDATDNLPELRLIEVEFDDAPAGVDVKGDIVAALAERGVTAELAELPAGAAGENITLLVRQIALWGALAFALVMAVIVALTARGLAARRREMVTVMTDLGATRGEAVGRIADEAAMRGLYAGLAGALVAALAAVAALLLNGTAAEMLMQMIRPLDFAPLAATPIVTAIAAGFGARAAAGLFYERAARVG
jgi:cell division transport system permease protein